MKLNCTCIYHLYFLPFFTLSPFFTIFYHFLQCRFPKITETKSSDYLDTCHSIFTNSGYSDIFNYMINFSSITGTKWSGYLDTYYSIFTYSGYFVILDTYYSIFTNSGSSDIVKYMIIFSSITEYTKKLVVLVIIVSSIFSMW